MDKPTREFYDKGAFHCEMNAISLAYYSSDLLYKERNKGHAIYLLHIAYEEMTKAIYCKLVSLGFVEQEEIDYVFKYHEPKVILFDKLFGGDVIATKDGIQFKEWKITKETLKNLRKERSEEIDEYTKFKLSCLYVDRENDWQLTDRIPIKILESKRQELLNKLQALELLLEALDTFKNRDFTKVEGFKLEWRTDEEGRLLASVSFDVK